MVLARSAGLTPRTSRELTNRSIETDGSPASILATRDWLECRRLASSICETPRRWRRSRRLLLKDSFISMSAASASDRPKNSCTDPTAHPAALSFSRLDFFIASFLDRRSDGRSRAAGVRMRQSPAAASVGSFSEDLQHDDGIRIGPVHDAKRPGDIVDAQFMASRPNGRHRTRIRKRQRFAALQQSQQVTAFDSGFLGKGRCLDFAAQPDDRFACLGLAHERRGPCLGLYVRYDILSMGP